MTGAQEREEENLARAAKGMLREQVRESVAALSDEARAQESERICWVLEGLLHPPREEVIGVFFPLKDEPDIMPLIEAMLRAGQKLAAPRIDEGKLVMCRFSSLEELVKGPYGNLEPSVCHPEEARTGGRCFETPFDRFRNPQNGTVRAVSKGEPEPEPAIILLPGLAFDRSGNRLGRGLGFYDRFIASERKEHPKTEFLGICFSCQLLENTPTLPHDQKVTRVVSADAVVSWRG